MKGQGNFSPKEWIPKNSKPLPKLLFLILLLSLLFNMIGIHWGLPSYRGWAADELTPGRVRKGIEKNFSNSWHDGYPPFHFYILSAFHLPFYLLNTLKIINIESLSIYTILFYIGRLISIFMSLGIIFLVYLCGCEILDKKIAPLASLITALTPPFLYYSKLANVDIPYIFWFTAALYFFLRILKYHKTCDYILFAAFATFSICTKDQAYGLFVLTPFIIVFSYYQFEKKHHRKINIFKAFINKKTLGALLTGIILFILIHNWVFNFSGFIRHLKLISGPAKGPQRFSATLTDGLLMLWQALKHIKFILGWPVFMVCFSGFIYAVSRKKKNYLLLSLVTPCISYYLFFLCVVGRIYVRYLIPVSIIFSFFGALFLSTLFNSPKKLKKLISLLILLVFSYSAVYSFSVNICMLKDSRYFVEEWMQQNIEKEKSIVFAGFQYYYPRRRKFHNTHYIPPHLFKRLKNRRFDYIVIVPSLLQSNHPILYKSLLKGKLGYSLVFRYQTPTPFSLITEETLWENGKRKIVTNLNKINPEIMVFKKRE